MGEMMDRDSIGEEVRHLGESDPQASGPSEMVRGSTADVDGGVRLSVEVAGVRVTVEGGGGGAWRWELDVSVEGAGGGVRWGGVSIYPTPAVTALGALLDLLADLEEWALWHEDGIGRHGDAEGWWREGLARIPAAGVTWEALRGAGLDDSSDFWNLRAELTGEELEGV